MTHNYAGCQEGGVEMAAPKYRTDSLACSCPGFWYRRTCKHHRAYREAVALVQAQDAVNKAQRQGLTDTCNVCRYRCFTSITDRRQLGVYR